MATRKSAAKGRDAAPPDGGVDLSTHPLVAERNVDPSEIEPPPPEQATLVGYIGPSSREGSVRLYQDLTFRNYYEIPSEAVLSTKPVNPDDENSPTVVQVEPDTKVEVVTVSVQSVEARYLSGSIAGGFYASAAGGAAAQGGGPNAPTCGVVMFTATCTMWPTVTTGVPQMCTNITTHMPSCVQHPCANITTHVPSCVGGGGPQVPGLAGTCGIGMTTRACTFGGTTTDIAPGTQVAAERGGYCTNITTYMPSCVQQQPCTNITTHMPSCVGQGGGPQVAQQNLCANITTYMPSCVGGGAQGAAQMACTNITTYMPSCVAQGGAQAAGGANLCANITTHMPSCVGGGGAELAARAVQPTPPQFCLTVVTANPTDCGQICLTRVTAIPTDCGVQPTPPQFCVTRFTANPTDCAPPLCLTVVTANPTDCGPCLAVVTANPTDCGPKTVVEAAAARAAVNVAPQPLCITLHTHYPSWCPPQPPTCQPIANTAATLCTQVGTFGTVLCPTVFTARPTGCG